MDWNVQCTGELSGQLYEACSQSVCLCLLTLTLRPSPPWGAFSCYITYPQPQRRHVTSNLSFEHRLDVVLAVRKFAQQIERLLAPARVCVVRAWVRPTSDMMVRFVSGAHL